MSAFRKIDDTVGFSTGALEKGNYRKALDWMGENDVRTVELSALRFEELKPLVESLDAIDLKEFDLISFHAPSSFKPDQEKSVIDLLNQVHVRGWNIIVHPDVIYNPELWSHYGAQLLIENMDRRKETGRTVRELAWHFQTLPKARLCLDVAHARQLDTSLNLLKSIIDIYSDRIAEIHISELDCHCLHQPLSGASVTDYQYFRDKYPKDVPVIIESMLDGSRSGLRCEEKMMASEAIGKD